MSPFTPSGQPGGGAGSLDGDPLEYQPSGCPSGGNAELDGVLVGGGQDPDCLDGGGGGDVVGPDSSTDDDFAQFDGTTGKLLKDGGYSPASFDAAGEAAAAEAAAEAYTDAAIAAHEAAPDPHPQYLIQAEADALYDALGAAAAAVAAHEAAPDPHPQYLTPAEADLLYEAIGTDVDPEKGDPGPAGMDGNDGQDGQDGLQGTPGLPGPQGQAGQDGGDGLDGLDGGPGPQGQPGPQGPTGPQGPDGLDGSDGGDGPPGPAGRNGANGCNGQDGSDGEDNSAAWVNSRGVQADALLASGPFALKGVISPTALAAQTNNWAPTGLPNATVVRVTLTGNQTLTGLTGGEDGRIVVLYNVDTVDILTLAYESASSTAANRFVLFDLRDLLIYAGQCVILQYDGTTSRWHLMSTSYNEFLGATAVISGTRGIVLAPVSGQQKTVLRGSGIWDSVTNMIDTLSASVAQGDVLYRGASVWDRLGAGTANQFLQTAGAGANPAWADLGSLVGVQSIAQGATTYTPTAGTKRALVWLCGAGGGGGAADWAAGTTLACAGGGGAGSQSMYRISAVSGTYTITVGAGGAGGVVGVNGGLGATGGNSTLVNGGTTVTAFGGVGAVQSTAGSVVATSLGGAGGAIATNGSFNPGAGDTGQHGVTLSGTVGWAGKGGHCHPFGSGGASRVAQAVGIAGTGFGSGGGGGVAGGSASQADKAGGAGADGRILVLEFA